MSARIIKFPVSHPRHSRLADADVEELTAIWMSSRNARLALLRQEQRALLALHRRMRGGPLYKGKLGKQLYGEEFAERERASDERARQLFDELPCEPVGAA